MRVTVKKWGNSASVPIPAAVMKAVDLHLGEAVDVREEQGRIIIEPIRAKSYDIMVLVDGITDDNVHAIIESGPAAGHEAWC